MEESKSEESKFPKVKTKESEMKNIYKSFQNNLDSLKFFIDALAPIASEKDSFQAEAALSIVKDILKEFGIDENKIEEDDLSKKNKKSVSITDTKLSALVAKMKRMPKVGVAHSRILYQSSFVLLVGYFEYLFSDLLKFYYSNFPGNIADKPIQVIINELKAYESIDEAIEYVVSKEVESILFDKTFNELIEFFNKILKIDLNENIINWDTLNETRERRHIIVHNNAIINKKYLTKSKVDLLPDKDELIVGKKVNVSNEYFNLAFDEVYLAGHVLIFNCWKQWVKNDTESIFNELLNTTFDCLKIGLNKLSNRLSFYSINLEPKTDTESDLHLRTKFNYYISLRELEKKEELEKELAKLNISSLSPIFKLAYFTLKEDKKKIIENIKYCKLVEDMKIDWLYEWPLFEEIRKDSEFLKLVEEEFYKS